MARTNTELTLRRRQSILLWPATRRRVAKLGGDLDRQVACRTSQSLLHAAHTHQSQSGESRQSKLTGLPLVDSGLMTRASRNFFQKGDWQVKGEASVSLGIVGQAGREAKRASLGRVAAAARRGPSRARPSDSLHRQCGTSTGLLGGHHGQPVGVSQYRLGQDWLVRRPD